MTRVQDGGVDHQTAPAKCYCANYLMIKVIFLMSLLAA